LREAVRSPLFGTGQRAQLAELVRPRAIAAAALRPSPPFAQVPLGARRDRDDLGPRKGTFIRQRARIGEPRTTGWIVAALQRSPAGRALAIVAIGTLLTAPSFGALARPIAVEPPAPVVTPAGAVRQQASVETGWPLDRPVRIDFRTPMDPVTVERNLRLEPAAPVRLVWSAGGRSLAAVPLEGWRPGAFYALTIGRAARDRAGQALGSSITAIFVTRSRPGAEIALHGTAGARLLTTGGIELTFSRPVAIADVREALAVTPETVGRILARGARNGFAQRFVWQPKAALRPGVQYTFRLRAAVHDREGVSLRRGVALEARTVARPRVVGQDPRSGASGIGTDTAIVIRFDRPMDRETTARALQVIGVGAVVGRVSWSENDTVLMFQPVSGLRHDRTYTVILTGRSRSRLDVPIAPDAARTAYSFRFRTEPAPVAVAPAAQSGDDGGSGGGTGGDTGGGGPVAAPWASVESYVLRLINCIRTGGLIRSDGNCDGYGSGHYHPALAPLTLHSGISTSVSRPYAKLVATSGACSHFLDGNPGTRLARAGYSSYRWAENLGCRSGNPYTAVLGSHLYFQSEEPYGGGHWVNLRNATYTTVGIGVWVSNGNVRVVTDFYDP
jgi:hypothetical protein